MGVAGGADVGVAGRARNAPTIIASAFTGGGRRGVCGRHYTCTLQQQALRRPSGGAVNAMGRARRRPIAPEILSTPLVLCVCASGCCVVAQLRSVRPRLPIAHTSIIPSFLTAPLFPHWPDSTSSPATQHQLAFSPTCPSSSEHAVPRLLHQNPPSPPSPLRPLSSPTCPPTSYAIQVCVYFRCLGDNWTWGALGRATRRLPRGQTRPNKCLIKAEFSATRPSYKAGVCPRPSVALFWMSCLAVPLESISSPLFAPPNRLIR